MCLVITKKFYDGRLSSTPLHTLIEKQAVRFCFLKVALQLYQSHLVEELCIPLDSMASVVCFTLSQKMAACLAWGVQSSSTRRRVTGHLFPHRQCVSPCILKAVFLICCDIFYCKLFLLNGSQR